MRKLAQKFILLVVFAISVSSCTAIATIGSGLIELIFSLLEIAFYLLIVLIVVAIIKAIFGK